jgi:cell division protein YceG involved in septum cleavage
VEDGAGESGEEPQGDGEVSGGEAVGADSNGEVTSHSLYIAYGESMDSVAGDLVQLGLFENRQAFTAALERNNAGSKVQAGTFVIPSNATEDEVVKIITGRPN